MAEGDYDGGDLAPIDIEQYNGNFDAMRRDLRWRTKEGVLIPIRKMDNHHLRNAALMLMGFGYQVYRAPDALKILWLSALRIEWERRMLLEKGNPRK